MEKASHRPHLANPTEAKKRMGKTNKTDALDAKGLAILLHNGTLPESWTWTSASGTPLKMSRLNTEPSHPWGRTLHSSVPQRRFARYAARRIARS